MYSMDCSWSKGDFEVCTDPARIDAAFVHQFLTSSYWAKGVPVEVVQRSIQNSLSFGMYHAKEQVGFARVITDRATFAYLADVFVLPSFRRRGLGTWLMECVFAHVELQGLRRWSLVTRDAHKLYQQFGFGVLKNPERWMERHDPEIYARRPAPGVL